MAQSVKPREQTPSNIVPVPEVVASHLNGRRARSLHFGASKEIVATHRLLSSSF